MAGLDPEALGEIPQLASPDALRWLADRVFELDETSYRLTSGLSVLGRSREWQFGIDQSIMTVSIPRGVSRYPDITMTTRERFGTSFAGEQIFAAQSDVLENQSFGNRNPEYAAQVGGVIYTYLRDDKVRKTFKRPALPSGDDLHLAKKERKLLDQEFSLMSTAVEAGLTMDRWKTLHDLLLFAINGQARRDNTKYPH